MSKPNDEGTSQAPAASPRSRSRSIRILLVTGVAILAVSLVFGRSTFSGFFAPERIDAPSAPPSEDQPLADQPLTDQQSHKEMLRLLLEVNQTSGKQPFIEAAIEKLKKQKLTMFPWQLIPLHAELSDRYFQLGRVDEAMAEMAIAEKHFARIGGRMSGEQQQRFLMALAVVHFRKGETDNCLHCVKKDGCIFPIRGDGFHDREEGSRKAIVHLEKLLALNPDHLKARWLLNLAHMTIGGYPDKVPAEFLIPPAAIATKIPFPHFENKAAEAGLNTQSTAGGAIVDDFNGDHVYDIVVSTTATAGQIRLFLGRGDGSFEEKTDEAGLTGIFGGLNCVHADYDNDGDLDIYVLRGAWFDTMGRHPNSLLRNDGKGNFVDVTLKSGLGDDHFPTQTADWGDYDLDGDLDLYVGNERFPCQLFRNNGDGTFTDVAAAAGVENHRFTKGVKWGDYDNDRRPDLYVSNMGSGNRLYHNLGDGKFEDVAVSAGVDQPHFGLPAWFWDFNNDGILDLFAGNFVQGIEHIASDYLGKEPVLGRDRVYQGDGKGGFTEVGVEVNLNRASQPMGSNFGDVDYDGFPDFYLGTGYPTFEGLMPNLFFHNVGGKRFEDVTEASGMGHLQKGHGVAFADLDHDGDQDVFIQLGGFYPADAFSDAWFVNPGFQNHWLTVRLVGKQSNRCALGAKIRARIVDGGTRRDVYKRVNSGGSFGCSPFRQEIGLGKATVVEELEIYWPVSDTTQVFRNVPCDQVIEIQEGGQEYSTIVVPTKAK